VPSEACRSGRTLAAVLLALAVAAAGARALQDEAQAAPAPAPVPALADLLADLPEGEPVTFAYNNREIVPLRMEVLGRSPAERAEVARGSLDRLVEQGLSGAVTLHAIEGGQLVFVGTHGIFAIADGDLSGWTDEQRAEAAAEVARRLELALAEAVELRTPGLLLRGGGKAAGATLLLAVLLFGLRALWRWLQAFLERLDRAGSRAGAGAPEDVTRLGLRGGLGLLLRAGRALVVVAGLVGAWAWLTFVLLQFPYLRPLGESLDRNLRGLLVSAFDATLKAVPDLAVAVAILLLARLVVRRSNLLFEAVQQRRVRMPLVDPETAQPTRRIVAFLLWVFAVVLAVPYLPGSDTEAFKGISVFLGLLISLGSTGVMGQALAGLMLMYARVLRVGDYVRLGESEGSVMGIGLLTTRLRSPWGEELVLPNSTILSQSTTNYSRYQREGGVMLRSAVSIGYDTPWRQVHALLLRAAERTPGVSGSPRPYVLQSALSDWYVSYELCAAVDVPAERVPVLSALHQAIQDEFNAHGVQIMSPQYLARAEAPVVVPPERWHAAPAAPDAGERAR
jgi:small-conductance mechanosensitive channel